MTESKNTSKQPDSEKEQWFSRLQGKKPKAVQNSVGRAEGLTQSQADKYQRGQETKVHKAWSEAKIVSIWALCGVMVLASLFVAGCFCYLFWIYVTDVSEDASKTAKFLDNGKDWVLIAFAALFLERKIRGDK